MSAEMKVEVISRETITPSSPSPPHLKRVEFSLFDQVILEHYVPLVLFYPNHADHHEVDTDHQSLIAKKSSILKASLSETLTHFYPLAGEFQYNDSICCDDRGAAFIEARVNCRVLEILKSPDTEMLKCLFPAAVDSTQALTGYLLLVQVNFFECGGLAIAINISHKVADAFTFSRFIKSWAAAVALGSKCTTDHHPIMHPIEFGAAASLYPAQDFLNAPRKFQKRVPESCTTRRFVFDASSIADLKSKATSAAVPSPTRNEVVSALIWKCAMEASRSNSGSIRPSLWSQALNMRKRSGQEFTENLLGNFVWSMAAVTTESEVDLRSLVARFRKCLEAYNVTYPNEVTAEQAYQKIKESAGNFLANKCMDKYSCSNWCRFPFYETNFGWGKPSWVSIRSFPYKNTVILMDAKDGNGIEAHLTLLEEDMAIFESNKELIAYASLNPMSFNLASGKSVLLVKCDLAHVFFFHAHLFSMRNKAARLSYERSSDQMYVLFAFHYFFNIFFENVFCFSLYLASMRIGIQLLTTMRL